MSTWAIVGIGLEFVRQLLARGDNVLATVRDTSRASQLWSIAGTADQGSCRLLECDVDSESSIVNFVEDVKKQDIQKINYVILNAGILKYPNSFLTGTESNRAVNRLFEKFQDYALRPFSSFDNFADHLRTNTIGPIIVAQKLLQTAISVGTVVFMSSDSGSAADFRGFEDGFAAYAASKAALNQMLRHMAAELQRQGSDTTILAMHPGEVATDMADVSLSWEVEGIMSTEDSVLAMLNVITTKTTKQTGTFWTWEGKEHPW
ncbi:hypothetical protein MMC12_003860 [Toensbergia leucococca]|nr:hypothetical protein [Toensbergia leucococca]